MLRPKVVLLTEKDSKNDFALDEMDFGIVNVDRNRTIKVFLSNQTEVNAKWQLNYVKFPKKTTISKFTTTVWEEENLAKIDDPDVFEFSCDSVSLSLVIIHIFRACLKENHFLFGKFQKACMYLQSRRTKKKGCTCPRQST